MDVELKTPQITIDAGGTFISKETNYNNLENKPSINNVTLIGNKSLEDLGINIPSLEGYATETWVENKGYTTNTGTITSVKMNGNIISTSGEADLGTVITQHQDISGKLDTSKVKSSYSTTSGDVYDVTYINSNMGGSYTAGTNIEITNANVINNTIPFVEEGNKVLLGTGTSGFSTSTAVGANATSSGMYSVAYGQGTQATSTGTIAMGHNARANLEGSMAFGRGATAEKQYQVVFGGASPVTEIAIGSPFNYKPLATQEYVDNKIQELLNQLSGN